MLSHTIQMGSATNWCPQCTAALLCPSVVWYFISSSSTPVIDFIIPMSSGWWSRPHPLQFSSTGSDLRVPSAAPPIAQRPNQGRISRNLSSPYIETSHLATSILCFGTRYSGDYYLQLANWKWTNYDCPTWEFKTRPHATFPYNTTSEVNISPKISISAQPLKMALHKNPAMHGSRIASRPTFSSPGTPVAKTRP